MWDFSGSHKWMDLFGIFVHMHGPFWNFWTLIPKCASKWGTWGTFWKKWKSEAQSEAQNFKSHDLVRVWAILIKILKLVNFHGTFFKIEAFFLVSSKIWVSTWKNERNSLKSHDLERAILVKILKFTDFNDSFFKMEAFFLTRLKIWLLTRKNERSSLKSHDLEWAWDLLETKNVRF